MTQFKLSDIRQRAFEISRQDGESPDDVGGFLDRIEEDATRADELLVNGCGVLGIPLVGNWQHGQAPAEIVQQLWGQVYELPLTVEYQGRECLVVACEARPNREKDLHRDLLSKIFETVKPGEVIPFGAHIDSVALVSADLIDVEH